MDHLKIARRFCPLLLPVLLAGCAVLGGGETVGQPGANPPSASTGQAASPSGAAAASDAAPGTPAGQGEPAAGQSPRDALASLLGTTSNYRFEIDAPQAFRADIASSTLIGRWQRRADYDPVQFEGLVGALHDEVLAIFRNQGYFSPDIQVESTPPRLVRVRARPGSRTHIRQLDVRIEGPGKDEPVLAQARAAFGLVPGAVFLPDSWQSGKRAVIDAMQRVGFLRARVSSSRVLVDAAGATAALSLVVDTGPRIAFGALQVQGLSRYALRIIEDLQTFRQGDPFNELDLLLFQSRLREAGYFSTVSALPNLLALAAEPEATEVPIQLILEEMPRYRVVYGLGYSTDDGPRGQFGFQDRNFHGLQMEASLMLSQRRQRAFTNFRTPFDSHNRYYGFGYRIEREQDRRASTLLSNLYAGYGQRQNDIESFTSLQFQLEGERFRDTGQHEGIKALVLGKAWSMQRFDSRLNPTRGFGLKFEISGASRRLYSDRTFTRLYASGVRFQPLPKTSWFSNGLLVGRLELGALNAGGAGGIPSENLFRTGGAQSLRGYAYRSLGLNLNAKTLGERYLAVGSLEYQHRISEMFSLLAFYDYGNVGQSFRNLDPVAGYGAGVLARTPIGPVRLEVAYGQALHRYRLHFSIGYTF